MVLIHLGGAPVGNLVGLAVPGQQRMTLLILENHQGLLAGGAIDPHPSHLQTPVLGFRPQVGQAVEISALEEALPDVLHIPLHLGLVLGVARPRRIGDETPVLGVLQKPLGEVGMQRVGAHHCGGEIIDHQVLGPFHRRKPTAPPVRR